MQIVFSPIVALMNRLTYPRKFVLFSLLFALPLIWVLLQFWNQEYLGGVGAKS